jgi:hypothetical protein
LLLRRGAGRPTVAGHITTAVRLAPRRLPLAVGAAGLMPSKRTRKAKLARTGLLRAQRRGAKQSKKHEETVGALVRDIMAAVNQLLGARLARLSDAERDAEMHTVASYMAKVLGALQTLAAERVHDERKRQAELGRRPRSQAPILEAARHYRYLKKMIFKKAWLTIKQKPYTTDSGETVLIEAVKGKEMMHVQSRDGTRKRPGIKEEFWQKYYWGAARV